MWGSAKTSLIHLISRPQSSKFEDQRKSLVSNLHRNLFKCIIRSIIQVLNNTFRGSSSLLNNRRICMKRKIHIPLVQAPFLSTKAKETGVTISTCDFTTSANTINSTLSCIARSLETRMLHQPLTCSSPFLLRPPTTVIQSNSSLHTRQPLNITNQLRIYHWDTRKFRHAARTTALRMKITTRGTQRYRIDWNENFWNTRILSKLLISPAEWSWSIGKSEGRNSNHSLRRWKKSTMSTMKTVGILLCSMLAKSWRRKMQIRLI